MFEFSKLFVFYRINSLVILSLSWCLFILQKRFKNEGNELDYASSKCLNDICHKTFTGLLSFLPYSLIFSGKAGANPSEPP